MRQKYVTPATVLVVAAVTVVLAAFALIRDGSNADSHEHEHESENMQSHDSPRQDDNSANDEPSGVLKDGERVIEVKARQFEFDPDSIVVRKGETVRLEITSQDVTHGFKLESQNVDTELKPNQTETVTFVPEKTGRFQFRCSVYCGQGHTDMNGELMVIEQDG